MLHHHRPIRLSLILGALAAAAGCSSGPRPELGVGYDEADSRILVTHSKNLADSETLHARVRRGSVDELDCGRSAGDIDRIDDEPLAGATVPTWRGPRAEAAMFEGIYDTSWLEAEPTAEMLEQARRGEHVIDVCLMDGDRVVRGKSFDIRRALDQPGENGKFDGEEEERIRSTVAYAERCVADLGEIPFFEKLGERDYATYNCLDSTPIPTTVTDADGNVEYPETEVGQCDNPQYIYSLCEPNAVDGRTNGPRVAQRSNEEGTHWVLLCRKAKSEEGSYNDIAMIGHNPYTGDTCFFQNALYSRTDGLHVPHPADDVDSEQSPQNSASLWQGIHGGLGSGIECAECHSNDAFIHTPWIDEATDENGDPIVPKMGYDDDFMVGYNEAPYSIINAAGQNWTMPKHLVSEEAAPCTRCHRIGNERWMNDWIDRLVAEDASWNGITTPTYRQFEHAFWMPPGVDGLDESSWQDSEFGRAIAFIQACGDDPSGCEFAELPTDPIADDGGLPTIELEGTALALESLEVLGADVEAPDCPDGDCGTRRCAECHSVSRSGLERWSELTDAAWNECGLDTDPADMTPDEAREAVDCLRVDPDDAGSVFAAAKLGILTTGVQYNGFRRLFQKAYGEDAWLVPYGRFKARVGMPKGSHPKLSQKEYATLLEWFGNGLNDIDSVLQEPPPPQECNEFFDTAALEAHVQDMQFDGWQAVNRENGIRMFGCAPDADPLTCFAGGEFADRSGDWGNGHGTVRELTELGFRTSFWTRSSADGRFVGNGGGTDSRATITDLLTGRDIAVEASYDPGFFPDNSGFIFQGAVGGAGICAQSLLEDDDSIDFTESECMSARGINLYQHVARGILGGDYFVINSQFTSDSGQASQDPSAHFNASSTMKFTPMIFNGTTYEQLDSVIVDSPYEGDSVLSPSSELVASRLAGPEGRPLGYVVRQVDAQRFGDAYTVNVDRELATVCLSGAKPSFSFDERFLVTHHYESGTANLLLVDLLTGERYQITDMPEGSYAQFPHFRSDGWIYFLVSGDDGDEYIAASDAAIRIGAE